MDWNINFRDDGILEITYSGDFSQADYLKVFEKFILEPGWKPGMCIIADFRKVNFVDMSIDDVITSVDMHSQFNDLLGNCKIAAIHSNIEGLKLGNLYKQISDLKTNSNIVTFSDYDDAVEWIQTV